MNDDDRVLAIVGETDRGGVVVEWPDCIAPTAKYVVRSRWATAVHQSATHTTYHVSVNPELDTDEVSIKPFGGDSTTFQVEGGPGAIPADHDDPSPDSTIPIEVAHGEVVA